MNVVKEIQRINQKEILNGNWDKGSWHDQYKNSAWIFAGNIPFDLTEGDVVCIFSQFGEIIHVELIRDQKTGKSKGFAFLQYEDQRSTVLAVDNLNGATILNRTLRVDHSHTGPRKPKKKDGEESEDDDQPKMNVAPELIEVMAKEEEEKKPKVKPIEVDNEDPMAAYFLEKHEKKSKKKSKKEHKEHKSSRRDRSSDRHRKEDRHSREDRPSREHRHLKEDRHPREDRHSRDDRHSRKDRYRSRSPRRRSSRSRSPPHHRY